MKYLLVLVSLLSTLAAKAEQQAEIKDARELVTRFLNNDLPREYQRDIAVKVEGLKKLSKTVEKNIFLCVGYKLNALVGLSEFYCSTLSLQTFKVSSVGVEMAAEASGNILIGYGQPVDGIHEMNFSAGLYGLFGGTIISGGGIKMGGVGLGLGAHLSYGVPSDSLFGGQMIIDTDRDHSINPL